MRPFPGLLYESSYNSEITDNRRIIFEILSAEVITTYKKRESQLLETLFLKKWR